MHPKLKSALIIGAIAIVAVMVYSMIQKKYSSLPPVVAS